MKTSIFIIFLMFFIPLPLFAEEADEELPITTPASIKESAEEVIRLGIDEKALVKMTNSMFENGFSEQQILRVHEILKEAKRENLHEDPIMDKFYEGVSKMMALPRIQTEDIVQVMEKIRVRYKMAYDYALLITRDKDQIQTVTRDIAECMTAGIEEDDMGRIVDMLQQRKSDMDMAQGYELGKETLKTVRTMVRTGAGTEDVINMIDNSFQKGYGSGEIRSLGDTFIIQAMTSSSPPSELVRSYSNAIKRGITLDSITSFGLTGESGGIGPGPSSAPTSIPSLPQGPGPVSSPPQDLGPGPVSSPPQDFGPGPVSSPPQGPSPSPGTSGDSGGFNDSKGQGNPGSSSGSGEEGGRR